MTEPARDSRTAATSDHRWLVLVIVAIAQLMVVLDATIVNIALLARRQDQDQPVTSAPAATAPDAIGNPAAHQ